MIVIVNTGGANISSITNALDRLDLKWCISDNPDTLLKAQRLILPGVGAAKASMDKIQKAELVDCIRSLKQPTMGICLGMQLLFEYSDEGGVSCLSCIPGKVSEIPKDKGLVIPHMGWNQLNISHETPLLKDVTEGSYVYFVHSYQAPVNEYTMATCEYGYKIPAVVQNGNFFGAQFHPEKSGLVGQQIIRNFAEI